MPRRSSNASVIPGFGLTLGLTVTVLTLLVLIPLGAAVLKASGLGWTGFGHAAFSARALAAYRLSFGAALVAALVNVVTGLLIAWVLVRYPLPGKRLVSAAVDLPFALPTAVAGIALASLYAPNGWLGAPLAHIGVRLAFAPAGVVAAMVFVGLPFVVRTVEPVLRELPAELEEAAASLGARPWQTFRRVLLPALTPALLTGFALAFARGVGEYGSVIFIAGNVPFRSEIAPLLIITELEQYDYASATAIAVTMLAASFVLLLLVNGLQHWTERVSR